MRNIFLLCLLGGVEILGAAGCGPLSSRQYFPLVEEQPRVVAISPPEGAVVAGREPVSVTFSAPIDPETVSAESFFITKVEEGKVDAVSVVESVSEGTSTVMEGSFDFFDDNRLVRFQPAADYPAEVRCGVVITPKILSPTRVPFNQTPGESPTLFFSSFYSRGGGELSEAEKNLPDASPPRPEFLRFSEIYYDASGDDTNGVLFLRLFGEPNRNVGDYQIIFVRGDDGEILNTLLIPKNFSTDAEGNFIVADAKTSSPSATEVAGATWVKNFDPPNGPDCLQLIDPDGNLADALGYGSPLVGRAKNSLPCFEGDPAPDAPSGQLLRRKDFSLDTDNNAADWEAAPAP